MPATMLERLTVPIEWKASEDDENVLEGYASTFGNVDLGGDVVMPGAFTKTIANIKANGIPLLADHMPTVNSVLGTIFDANEDSKGLKIRARLSSAQSVQDARTKMIEGHVNKMSIGYQPIVYKYGEHEGQDVRFLEEIKLWETSVVVLPMNPQAVISRVKSMLLEIADVDDAPLDFDAILADVKAAQASLNTKSAADTHDGTPNEPPAAGAGEGGTLEQSSGTDEVSTTGDEPIETDAPASDAADKAAGVPDEGQGWDKWTSRALLADRPTGPVDPVKRAELTTLLELAEGQFDDPE